jgi:hypothetical protein
MKKFLAVALVAALLVPASAALAANTTDGLAFFFDTRDTTSAISPQGGALGNAQWDAPIVPWSNELDNNGGRGDGQVRFVSPVIPSGNHVSSGFDSSAASTFLYMDVEDRAAGDDDIISSVGLDIGIAKDSGDYDLDAATGVSFTMFNDAADVGGGATTNAWDDTAVGTVGVTGISGIKAVRVPVAGAVPAYDATLGLGIGGTYRLAQVDFQGGDRPPFQIPAPTPAVFSAKMAVNSLLVTRVYNPAGGAGTTPEQPDFGYSNGLPEAASVPGIGGLANGSDEGTTSTAADLVIVVKAKGDFDQDGNMSNDDINAFIDAFVNTLANDVEARWTVDFTGDNANSNDDINGFIAQFTTWGTN